MSTTTSRHTYGYEWKAQFTTPDGLTVHGSSWDRRDNAVRMAVTKLQEQAA